MQWNMKNGICSYQRGVLISESENEGHFNPYMYVHGYFRCKDSVLLVYKHKLN